MFKDSLKTIVLSLIILSLVGIAYAWTEPTVSPPNPDSSVSKPITTSTTPQTKAGGLVIDSLGISNSASNALTVTGGISAGGQIKSSSGGFVFPNNTVQTSAASTITESDPTVTASVKDGVSWGEVSGIPAGFADGVDDTGSVTKSPAVYQCPAVGLNSCDLNNECMGRLSIYTTCRSYYYANQSSCGAYNTYSCTFIGYLVQ